MGERHVTLPRLVSVFPLYSTDLNSPSEPVDIGRDPSFSFYIGPAAILRVNSVLAPLLDRLPVRHKTDRHCKVMFLRLCLATCLSNYYHEASVADVPCKCRHGPFPRVYNRVLNDVC